MNQMTRDISMEMLYLVDICSHKSRVRHGMITGEPLGQGWSPQMKAKHGSALFKKPIDNVSMIWQQVDELQ